MQDACHFPQTQTLIEKEILGGDSERVLRKLPEAVVGPVDAYRLLVNGTATDADGGPREANDGVHPTNDIVGPTVVIDEVLSELGVGLSGVANQNQGRRLDSGGQSCYNLLHRSRIVFVAGVSLTQGVDNHDIWPYMVEGSFEENLVFIKEDIKWPCLKRLSISLENII